MVISFAQIRIQVVYIYDLFVIYVNYAMFLVCVNYVNYTNYTNYRSYVINKPCAMLCGAPRFLVPEKMMSLDLFDMNFIIFAISDQ